MEKLKVGDKIYQIHYGKIVDIHIVERITKTLAVCQYGKRFKIEYYSPNMVVNKDDKNSWDNNIYRIETPELIEKLYRQQTILTIQKTDYDMFSTDKLSDILNIISGELIKILKNDCN